MKIRPVGAELFYVVGQTDRQTDVHDGASIGLSQFFVRPKNLCYSMISHTCLSLFVTAVFMVMMPRGRAGRTKFAEEIIAFTSNIINP